MTNTEINTNIIEKGNTGLPKIKELVLNGDFEGAFKVLGRRIEAGIEKTKDFLQDLFKVRETTKNLSPEDTKIIEENILKKYLIKV